MTANRIDRSGPMLSKSDINEVVRQIGRELPRDYRDFMLKNNGGVPEMGYFSLPECDTKFWVDDFCIIDKYAVQPHENAGTDSIAFQHYQLGSIMPPNTLIIGSVCRDSRLLLYLKGDLKGKVYLVYWDEVPEGPEELTRSDVEKGLHYVAPSFSAFLGMLQAN